MWFLRQRAPSTQEEPGTPYSGAQDQWGDQNMGLSAQLMWGNGKNMVLERGVWIQITSLLLPDPLGLLKILKVKLNPSQSWHDVRKEYKLAQAFWRAAQLKV